MGFYREARLIDWIALGFFKFWILVITVLFAIYERFWGPRDD